MSYHGSIPLRPPMQQYDSVWSTPQRQASTPAILPSTVTLSMRQQPVQALATSEGKEKTRKPIDPPPIVRIDVDDRADPNRHFLFSPHLFVMATLIPDGADIATSRSQKGIIGETCSAIHRLKDTDNKEAGFFVFGDISVRKPGKYRLHFSLFNNESTAAYTLVAEIYSSVFTVYSSKDFHGMDESTIISRSFNEQGVRLRMRKEPRSRQAITYQPQVSLDSQDDRRGVRSDYQQLSHQQYTTQALYQSDRGMKRGREEEGDLRIPHSQMPRTSYYADAFGTQPNSQQFPTLGLSGQQHYPVQQMLPQSIPQTMPPHTSIGHHPYLGTLDPEIFR